jgi:hypothetical protein
LVWTDGSRVNGAAGYGVFFGKDNGANLAARVVGDQTSDNAERLAVLHALESTLGEEKICIVTDNESVQMLLRNAAGNAHCRTAKVRRAVERRIVALVKHRIGLGFSTRCEHVYSHLPEKRRARKLDVAWQSRLRIQMDKWGGAFRLIVRGNEEADRLAARGAALPAAPQYSRVKEGESDLGVFFGDSGPMSASAAPSRLGAWPSTTSMCSDAAARGSLTPRRSPGRWPVHPRVGHAIPTKRPCARR